MALIILVLRVLPASPDKVAIFAGGLLGLHAVRAGYSALVVTMNQHRKMPVVTRNIDLGKLRIPDAPPRRLAVEHTRKMLQLDLAPMAGGLAWALTATFGWALAGVCLALAAGAAGCVIMGIQARRNSHLGNSAQVTAMVNAQIQARRPEVVLYFSGPRDAAYQVNMWLSVLERLSRPAVVVMRERWMVPLLGRTTLPVVCLDGMVDLVNFPMPSIRVALYPSNTSKNLHLLRMPGIGHVFAGHGDSDKDASVNPFSKAYDEVWVAGTAGRDRYLRAEVGVRDEDIVEVGRPQLADLRTTTAGPADRMFTVLYAPTWEGWSDEHKHSSLITMGAAIARALTKAGPDIRVLFKPHPLTGTRDAAATRAHKEIAALIDAANQRREASAGWAGRAGAGSAERAAAAAEAVRIAARLQELSGDGQIVGSPGTSGGHSDYAMLCRDNGPDPLRDAEWAELNTAWHDAYWKSQGWWRHRVVTGPLPTLYECFNQADLLITDISSVAADFVATGKPYVVTNVEGRGDAQFREQFPTAGAAYLLGPGCAELPEILAQAGGPGDDRLAHARQELRHYLLGPDSPDAQTRFNDAVDALIERVERARRKAAGLPEQAAELAAEPPAGPAAALAAGLTTQVAGLAGHGAGALEHR
jgi:hypothetical protein